MMIRPADAAGVVPVVRFTKPSPSVNPATPVMVPPVPRAEPPTKVGVPAFMNELLDMTGVHTFVNVQSWGICHAYVALVRKNISPTVQVPGRDDPDENCTALAQAPMQIGSGVLTLVPSSVMLELPSVPGAVAF